MATTITLTLPDNLAGWIDKRVGEGGYATREAYVSALLRNEQRRAQPNQTLSMEELQHMLDDSVASGISDKSVSDIFEDALKRVESRRSRFG